jgi:hypothetical protein
LGNDVIEESTGYKTESSCSGDPIQGNENLVWAPNWGHPFEYAEAGFNAVDKAATSNAGQPKGVIRQALVNALKTLARQYINGKWRPKP